MIHTPHVDWFSITPILILVGGSFVTLLCAVLVPAAWRRPASVAAAVATATGAIVTSVWLYVDSGSGHRVIADSFYRDRWTALSQVIICTIALATVLVGAERVREHEAEFYALLLASTAGMAFFVGAANLMTMFLSLEWFSIALYVMCAIDYDLEGSLEAGLKYLIVGSFGSASLLFGSALVYGATNHIGFAEIGATGHPSDTLLVLGLAMLIAGLGFKASAAPFHMWTPDVYEGAPTPVTAFFASAPKVAALAVFTRVALTAFPGIVPQWQQIIVFVAIASMVLGSFAAIGQKNIKRLMAYSSIGHMGFALVGLASGTVEGAQGVLVYIAIYVAMTLGTFAVILSMKRDGQPMEQISDFSGLSRTNPMLAFFFAMLLFSLAGIPPLAGFFAKWYVFVAAIKAGLFTLAVVGVLSSVVGAFYYLTIIKVMYFDEPTGQIEPMRIELRTVLAVAGIFNIFFFVYPGPLVSVATTAAKSLFPG